MNNQTLIVETFSEVLMDATIDQQSFRVTWNPLQADSCILWFRDICVSQEFQALGKFSNFDKKRILSFIVEYVFDANLRQQIERRKFEQRLMAMHPGELHHIEKLRGQARIKAFRQLFNLDEYYEPSDIAWKKRIMARRFHPDTGGDSRAMATINEAYECISKSCVN